MPAKNHLFNNSFDWLFDLDGNPETILDLNHEIKKPLELSENIPIHNYVGTEKFDLMTAFLHEIGHALGLEIHTENGLMKAAHFPSQDASNLDRIIRFLPSPQLLEEYKNLGYEIQDYTVGIKDGEDVLTGTEFNQGLINTIEKSFVEILSR